MATMMNGYHFDRAKDGANEYAVRINKMKVIQHANHASALEVFKYAKETMLASEDTYPVELIKEYDAKTKSHVDVVVKKA